MPSAPTKPKKIMYLLDLYDDPYGGTENQLQQLIKHIDKARFLPYMTVLRSSQYLENNEFPCPVRVLNVKTLTRISTFVKLIRYARMLKKEGFTLVHIFLNDASIVAPVFLKASRLKVVISRRDMGYWYNPVNIKLLRLNQYFVDKVVCNSKAVRQHTQWTERYPNHKLAVIYNGYDLAQPVAEDPISFATPRIPAGSPIVGLVANLRPIKRVGDAIRALALVGERFPTAHLVIIGKELDEAGGSGHQAELESLAQLLGVANKVHFVGQSTRVAATVRHFTIGVLCSESEGFPNAILECMAAGVPTICTNVGGNPEIIKNAHNGFLVEAGDVPSIADRIEKLLSDQYLARLLGRNALRDVTEKYPVENMVKAQMALYAELLGDPV
jgi:glycosyltransferase involved in cell wall biosynthesis